MSNESDEVLAIAQDQDHIVKEYDLENHLIRDTAGTSSIAIVRQIIQSHSQLPASGDEYVSKVIVAQHQDADLLELGQAQREDMHKIGEQVQVMNDMLDVIASRKSARNSKSKTYSAVEDGEYDADHEESLWNRTGPLGAKPKDMQNGLKGEDGDGGPSGGVIFAIVLALLCIIGLIVGAANKKVESRPCGPRTQTPTLYPEPKST